MGNVAYVISDYPILSSGIRRSLEGSHTVIDLTWTSRDASMCGDASLVVLDVTGVESQDVLAFLAGFRSRVRIAVSSLDRNEVDMYLFDGSGLSRMDALPSLLSLSA
jgi:hypothetical protein